MLSPENVAVQSHCLFNKFAAVCTYLVLVQLSSEGASTGGSAAANTDSTAEDPEAAKVGFGVPSMSIKTSMVPIKFTYGMCCTAYVQLSKVSET